MIEEQLSTCIAEKILNRKNVFLIKRGMHLTKSQ